MNGAPVSSRATPRPNIYWVQTLALSRVRIRASSLSLLSRGGGAASKRGRAPRPGEAGSLSRPHPRLLPLPPFPRWRRGFQARPGTAPRRGRPQARPQPGAAAPRVAAATAASTPQRRTQAWASTPGSSRSLLPRSSGRGCKARALPGAAWWRGSPPAQVSSSSGDFGPDIHGSGAFALRFLDSESSCVQHGSPGEEGPRRGGLWCGGPGARGPWCGRGRPNNHPSRSAGDSVLNT